MNGGFVHCWSVSWYNLVYMESFWFEFLLMMNRVPFISSIWTTVLLQFTSWWHLPLFSLRSTCEWPPTPSPHASILTNYFWNFHKTVSEEFRRSPSQLTYVQSCLRPCEWKNVTEAQSYSQQFAVRRHQRLEKTKGAQNKQNKTNKFQHSFTLVKGWLVVDFLSFKP